MSPIGRHLSVRTAGALIAVALTVTACGQGSAEDASPIPSTHPTAAASASADEPAAASTRPATPLAPVPVQDAALTSLPAPAAPPASLSIARLGIEVPIDPVGVAPDGQMEIPPLAERAGWYRFGASPAEAEGSAVIAAHVDSVASAGLGPFARLQEATPGDVVDVVLADGSTRQYSVSTVGATAKSDVAWPEVFTRSGAHRLVLITCGGQFQRSVGAYSDNVIVTADPVGG